MNFYYQTTLASICYKQIRSSRNFYLMIWIFAFLIILAGCSGKEIQKTTDSPEFKQLAEWMTGSYNSYLQSVQDESYYNITLEMHPIWEGRTDGKWLYVEQAVAAVKHRPYRQRVYHIHPLKDGKFESKVYTLPTPEKYMGKYKDPSAFDAISPDSLSLREGCSIVLTRQGNMFVGETGDKTCESSLRGASYATSKVFINAKRLKSWDQGFDDKGEQVWGAVKGPYIFNKVPNMEINYPSAERQDVTDDYHGTSVADPYRWLEDPNSEATNTWIDEQNTLTNRYLDAIPFRSHIADRLEQVWNFERYSIPQKHGDYYYFFKNDGLQNHSIYYRKKGLDGEPEVFLDPNKFSDDGTVSLTNNSFSKDHKYFAYGTSKSGSDWREFHVMDATTGKKMTDHLQHIKFSGIEWFKDGFFYSRFDAPEEGQELKASNRKAKIYYHKIGTDQSKDKLIFHDPKHERRSHYLFVSGDEKYLILSKSQASGHGNALFFSKASMWQTPDFQPIIEGFESRNRIIESEGNKWLMVTDQDAPKKKLVKMDIRNPGVKNWKTIIPEQEEVLRGVYKTDNKIVAHYMKDVVSRLYLYDEKGNKTGEIGLPGLGTVSGFTIDKDSNSAFYRFASYVFPPTIYQYDFETGESTIFVKPDIDFPFEDYKTSQVFFPSKDGTKIPMFITHHKDNKLNGHNPTLLYGYGGFNISYRPEFKVENLPFYESGGVYAVVNLRGGSEYGEEWHKAGMLEKKQNVFDDFIAASEYLIREGYTSREKLAVTGRSNGGLLIGAVLNQRPDLFKVALPVVGVMDMLRYHKFTIGWAWTGEYGSSENSDHFDFLYKYSPYHNISKTEYPATLVLTAVSDDRVVPAHSYKYAAQLQHSQTGTAPTLIRIDKKSGHGSGGQGKTTRQRIEEFADRWAFTFKELEIFPGK